VRFRSAADFVNGFVQIHCDMKAIRGHFQNTRLIDVGHHTHVILPCGEAVSIDGEGLKQESEATVFLRPGN
jgi:hypothetical protein